MKVLVLIIIVVVIIVFCKSKSQSYWNRRKNLKYYTKCRQIVNELSKTNDSILDVGGWKGEFLQTVDFKHKTITDLHEKSSSDIDFIQGDFLKIEIPKHDVVTCMQVLEHIDDNNVESFSRKLFEQSNNYVMISVPYKWKKGSCKHHLQDPVDENKVFNWTHRTPIKTWIITENNGVQRLILLYRN